VGRRAHPDSLFVSSNGQAIRPESSPGYCRDHPGVRDGRPRLLRGGRRAGAGRARPSSAGTSGASRTSSTGRTRPTSPTPSSASARTRSARFREWLRAEVRHARRGERAWYRRFASWDEVEPSRLSTILSYTDYIDWKAFIADKLGEDLRDRYEAVKRGAPDRVTSHAAGVGPLRLAAPLGGPVRRLDDGRAGRLLRDVVLPEALGVRGPRRALARGAARLHALVRLRRGGAGSGSASCRAASGRSR
jgi:hypothetical protein